MISINTNLSSLIAQSSMKKATFSLNQAVERMTTGFKINHAKDNAANYSISQKMTTKINSYMVAQDNVAMGLDMLTTAEENLNLISDKLTRLRDLATQASNGTYGESSLNAINQEANALVDEIERLYNTTEYNGKKLYEKDNTASTAGLTTPTYSAQKVRDMTTLTKAIEESALTSGGEYSISSAEELAKLAEIVNNGTDTTGMTFVLANDIDLAQWCKDHEDTGGWVPIGKSGAQFSGNFDGNGHVIKNVIINRATSDYQGLFGMVLQNASLKNIGLEGGHIIGATDVGALAGNGGGSIISNCYANIDITSHGTSGGLIGFSCGTIENCYATGNINNSYRHGGGLIGYARDSAKIINCYAAGDIIGNSLMGGLIGYCHNNIEIKDCFANGNVKGDNYFVGGLIGRCLENTNLLNCYALGDVEGLVDVGGLIGATSVAMISGCYSMGNVIGHGNYIGGLVGDCSRTNLTQSYSKGNVLSTTGNYLGGLVGGTSEGDTNISNCYSTGDIDGENTSCVGGLLGYGYSTTIKNCYSYGFVKGATGVGGFAGLIRNNSQISNSYTTGDVIGTGNYIGGFVGRNYPDSSVTNCAKLSDISTNTESTTAILMSLEEIEAKYTNEMMGFTEDNGWTVVNGVPVLSWQKEAKVENKVQMQVGTTSNSNSQITADTGFSIVGIDRLRKIGVGYDDCISKIDMYLNLVSDKATSLGASTNRLESALDEIETQYNNLVSSRSTLRDADIAEESSAYIRQQILQEASATLLATANQSPAIALQLI